MMVPLPRGSMFGPVVKRMFDLVERLALGAALAAAGTALAYVLTRLGIV